MIYNKTFAFERNLSDTIVLLTNHCAIFFVDVGCDNYNNHNNLFVFLQKQVNANEFQTSSDQNYVLLLSDEKKVSETSCNNFPF